MHILRHPEGVDSPLRCSTRRIIACRFRIYGQAELTLSQSVFQLYEQAVRSSRETFTRDRLHDMEKRSGQRPGSIVIVGCGRLGALLASHLSRSGSRVVVIDRDRDSFTLLEAGFSGFCVTGDAVEHDVLREAGLAEADCLLAVTEKDTLNLMVAQVAKSVFEVPQVIARVYDPHRVALYRRLGIETISPTSLTAREFLHVVTQKKAQS
jgi:trk system potassium uptake protein TrkA